MKNQQKENHIKTILCKEHHEKCAFVCLHKTCQNGFKVGCPKCKREHAQHPNRLISIPDFHQMLTKPIRYLQNSTAYKLMNLKKKIQYIRNFRTNILEKQILLIDSNQNIKSTASAILEEHYRIREIVSHLDPEVMLNNQDEYLDYLQKCRQFLAFNPVKGDLVFNNEVIKNSRVLLEKHLKVSHDLIDNIRQFLVKIIEVLLANCAHEEDDDDIEFDDQDGDSTSFNIFIKNRTDVIENPNIKSKIEHQAFLEMFDEEKDALNQEINILQKELDVKVGILNRIRSTSNAGRESVSAKTQKKQSEDNIDFDEELQKKSENNPDSRSEDKEKTAHQMFQMKQQYENVINNKEDYINELKEQCRKLQEKIDQMQTVKKEEKSAEQMSMPVESCHMSKLEEYRELNKALLLKIQQLQSYITSLTQASQQKQLELQELSNKLSTIQQNSQIKPSEYNMSQADFLEEITKKQEEYNLQLNTLKEELQRNRIEFVFQRKNFNELEELVQKMREEKGKYERQMEQKNKQYEQREKQLRQELEKTQKQIEDLQNNLKIESNRSKQQQQQTQHIQSELKATTSSLLEKQQALIQKEAQLKQLSQQLLRSKTETELKTTQNTESTIKLHQQQNKKIKQIKDMLELSIKKNQELKNKNYQLELDLQDTLGQLKMLKKENGRTSEKIIKQNNLTEFQQWPRIDTPHSELNQSPTRNFKKNNRDKNQGGKQQKRHAYLEIKSIFRTVTEDIKTLEERLKQNNVIEKVYLKELERKRIENKNLKKQLENFKLYGNNPKTADSNRPMSPLGKPSDKNRPSHSPLNAQAILQSDNPLLVVKKPVKNTK